MNEVGISVVYDSSQWSVPTSPGGSGIGGGVGGLTQLGSLDESPSSYPLQMHYFNLLVLEMSFQNQYSEHRSSEIRFGAFFIGLNVVCIYFFYIVLIDPSTYYGVHLLNKLILTAALISYALFYVSGTYRRRILIPRRFVNNANKTLRPFHLKLVSIRRYFTTQVHLIILPKIDSAYREGWEIYRQEYYHFRQKYLAKHKNHRHHTHNNHQNLPSGTPNTGSGTDVESYKRNKYDIKNESSSRSSKRPDKERRKRLVRRKKVSPESISKETFI